MRKCPSSGKMSATGDRVPIVRITVICFANIFTHIQLHACINPHRLQLPRNRLPGLPRAEQRYHAVHHRLHAANPPRDALAGVPRNRTAPLAPYSTPRPLQHPSPLTVHPSTRADGRYAAACAPQHHLPAMDSAGRPFHHLTSPSICPCNLSTQPT